MNDKNSTIGLMLMMALLGIYFFYFYPQAQKEAEIAQQQQIEMQKQIDQQQDELDKQAEITNPTETPQQADSSIQAEMTANYGAFAPIMDGEAKTVNVKTDKLDLTLTTKGGTVEAVYFTEHKTYGGEPQPLWRKDDASLVYSFPALVNARSISLESSDIYFTTEASSKTVTGDQTATVKMIAKLDDNRRIEHIYTFTGDAYDIGFETNFVGMDKVMKNKYLNLDWDIKVPLTEKDITPQRQKTNISYRQGADIENLGGRLGGESSEESVKNGVDWVSLRSQFFSSTLIPDNAFSDAELNASTPSHEDFVKDLNAKMAIDLESTSNGRNMSMTWFMGPNDYKILKSYDAGLEEQLDLGPFFLITWINKGTIWLFNTLEKSISSYGIIILIFAFLVKMIVFPMTYKSYVSMAKLRVINGTPEMKELDEKYKGDPQKLNLEKMAVYKKMKVSPLGGCLPMILQYPILIAMFYFFPQSVELRQKSFLWAEDLSTYDSIYNFPDGFSIPGYGDHVSLFCLLMVVSIYIYTYFQQKSQATNTAAMPFMKYLPYMFPIMFLIFLNNYASGLSWYYLAANVISIIQTTGIRASLNDEKLLTEMRAAATKKGKKKGKGAKKGGQSRLERWADKQQAKQRENLEAKRGNTSSKGGSNRTAKKKRK
ncbi:MAG: membrane protein insertase YidC [Bacteroidia bacterium]